MREILFRGKLTDTGKWVYGDYVRAIKFDKSIAKNCIVENESIWDFELHTSAQEVFEVIPETLGQHTGLTDKNGKGIFEGDIVKDDRKYIYIVKFGLHDIDCCGCCYTSHQSVGFYLDYINGGNIVADDDSWEYLTVIGNIHDNPELLNEGGEG